MMMQLPSTQEVTGYDQLHAPRDGFAFYAHVQSCFAVAGGYDLDLCKGDDDANLAS